MNKYILNVTFRHLQRWMKYCFINNGRSNNLFSIWNHHKCLGSFRFIWIHMLRVYDHYTCFFNSFSTRPSVYVRISSHKDGPRAERVKWLCKSSMNNFCLFPWFFATDGTSLMSCPCVSKSNRPYHLTCYAGSSENIILTSKYPINFKQIISWTLQEYLENQILGWTVWKLNRW